MMFCSILIVGTHVVYGRMMRATIRPVLDTFFSVSFTASEAEVLVRACVLLQKQKKMVSSYNLTYSTSHVSLTRKSHAHQLLNVLENYWNSAENK